jgi:hypothetical protein
VNVKMTAAEASDILDDLTQLDGAWEATHALMQSLEAIVFENQAAIWPPARTLAQMTEAQRDARATAGDL